jgi:hypothetical protein
MKNAASCLAGALGVLLAGVSDAQPPQHAYPAKGQSAARQHHDEAECSTWATDKSGYDPQRPPPVGEAQPAPVTGSGARVRGAAVGAAVGGSPAGTSATRRCAAPWSAASCGGEEPAGRQRPERSQRPGRLRHAGRLGASAAAPA